MLVKELGERAETTVLEALWRYHHTAVAADAAPAIIKCADARLLGLVLDEILSPSLEPPVPQAIANALTEHRPQLAKADAERLIERLLDQTPLHPHYEPARPSLEMWALEQAGKLGEDFAIDVMARRTPKSEHGVVRDSAYLRCRASARVLDEAAQLVAADLERSPSVATWQQAADFIEQACRNTPAAPPSVAPILDKLIERAPQYSPQDTFGPELRRLAVTAAIDPMEKALARDLGDTPGGRAIVRAVPEVRSASRRARLFALIARSQPALWVVLQHLTQQWDETEWRRVLRALVGADPIHQQALSYLVQSAPIELTRELMALTMSQVSSEDELIRVVGERLRQRLTTLGEGSDTRDAWVAAVHWPKARDAEALTKFAAITGCVEGNLHTRLIVSGYITGKLPAKTAAELTPEGQVARALTLVAPGKRGEWAVALAAVHPDAIGGAVSERVAAGEYPADVVAALAPSRSDVAFAAVAEQWPDLEAAEKDDLLVLLENHATDRDLKALETIVREDHRDNAKRRARATLRIASLLEPGAAVPDSVIGLLDSNLQDLREAAVQAIGRVKPREPNLIAKLHQVVERRGAAGKAAATALDALARDFLRDMAAAKTKAELHEVIPLLGAVGRVEVLRPLFDHVGRDAVWDDPAVHRAAAAAIREAAERVERVGTEDHETLVGLIDGEEQETDPDARADLSSALARLQLGDDAALRVLYDEIQFTPKLAPDRLFGQEKEPLVRQLGLYTRAKSRGEAGWGAELAHLDNIAERLVRAAYLGADGASLAIVAQIQNDPREPDYGKLIGALSSVKVLQSIQGDCKVLHDARCRNSEIPHAGEQADAATMTTARQCFKKLAKVCVGSLSAGRPGA